MKFTIMKRIAVAAASTALLASALLMPTYQFLSAPSYGYVYAASGSSISDMPSEYQYAADWIWNTRIQGEKSVEGWDTIYDQIVAGDGTLHYIVKWHSYKSITLQQRQNLQQVLEKAVNEWTDWLVGYENWPYQHVNVKIVGWAVLDESLLLDRQSDEVVYTDTVPYDSSYDIEMGMGDSTIPTIQPIGPHELYRNDHWADTSYVYPGGYENRFDMYLQATQGLIDMGGYGYYWGQQLSDNAVLGLADGTTSIHILEHEIGHGFGLTDFYGGEGESDGIPPGGFPGGSSIMEAGSSMVITDFDGWMFRYVWSMIQDEEGRFDLSVTPTEPSTEETTEPATETPTDPSTEETTEPTEPSTEPSSETPDEVLSASFTDTITDVGETYVTFAEHGTFALSDDYYNNDPQKNLANYDAGDKVSISFRYTEADNTIILIESLTLLENVRDHIKGDVNADGAFTLSDIVMMQKYLLKAGTLNDWEAGDLYEDGIIDVFDLALMKRLFLQI